MHRKLQERLNFLRPDFTASLFHFTRHRVGPRHFEKAAPTGADDFEKNGNDSEGFETWMDSENWTAPSRSQVAPLQVLKEILDDGVVRGSTHESGQVKGGAPATCFCEIPVSALKFFVGYKYAKYSPYGIVVSKASAYDAGGRPVIYLPEEEADWIPTEQQWRHVRFEPPNFDVTFEREWRVPGDFPLMDAKGFYVIAWNPKEEYELEQYREKYHNLRGIVYLEHLLMML